MPEKLLRQIDRAAKQRGESRSRFVVRVLSEAVRARRDADVTRRLDELFADEQVRREQLDGARRLEDASTRWEDEQW